MEDPHSVSYHAALEFNVVKEKMSFDIDHLPWCTFFLNKNIGIDDPNKSKLLEICAKSGLYSTGQKKKSKKSWWVNDFEDLEQWMQRNKNLVMS